MTKCEKVCILQLILLILTTKFTTYISYCFPNPIFTCNSNVRQTRLSIHKLHFQKSSLEHNSITQVFIFGLGYVGEVLLQDLRNLGIEVCGTSTNVTKIRQFKNNGIKAYLFDNLSGPMIENEGISSLYNSSHIISTIPPDEDTGEDYVLKYHGNDIKQVVLNGCAKWMGYISSTGIYGDCNGNWVNENTLLKPENQKTIARAKADNAWWSLYERNSLPVHIFRSAGIYGPNRNVLDVLKKFNGDFQVCGADDTNVISRIHVSDLVNVIIASMIKPSSGLKVNVADDLPATRYDALLYASRLLEYPLQPPTISDSSNNIKKSRGGSKRIDNTAMKKLLRSVGINSLQYPDYRSGLQAIFEGSCSNTNNKINHINFDNNDNNLINRIEKLEEKIKELEERINK